MSTSTLHIDLIHPEDAERLSRLARQAYYDHFPYLWEDGGVRYVSEMFSEDILYQELADPQTHFYLACQNQQPVGYMKINLIATLDGINNALELSCIYLIKEAAGQGIGKELVQQCFAVAQALQREVVWLKVLTSSNESIAFYQKLGFIKHKKTTFNFPLLKAHDQPMYVMKKMLLNS